MKRLYHKGTRNHCSKQQQNKTDDHAQEQDTFEMLGHAPVARSAGGGGRLLGKALNERPTEKGPTRGGAVNITKGISNK